MNISAYLRDEVQLIRPAVKDEFGRILDSPTETVRARIENLSGLEGGADGKSLDYDYRILMPAGTVIAVGDTIRIGQDNSTVSKVVPYNGLKKNLAVEIYV